MNISKLLTGSLMMFGLLVGCNFNAYPSSNANSDHIEDQIIETYAMQSFIGVKLLSTALESPYVGSPTGDSRLNDTSSGLEEDSIIDNVTQYIELMDTLLAMDSKPMNFEYLTSDNDLYAYQVRFTLKDLRDFEQTYTIYYNYQTVEDINDTGDSESEETSNQFPIIETPFYRHHNQEDDEDRFNHDHFSTDRLMDRTDINDFTNHRGRKVGDQLENDRVVIEGIVIIEDLIYELIGIEVITESMQMMKFFIALTDQHWIKIQSRVGEHGEGSMIAIKNNEGFYKMHYQVMQNNLRTRIMLRTLINGVLSSYMFHKTIDGFGNSLIRIKVINGQTILHIVARGIIDNETGDIVYQIQVRETGNIHDHHSGGRPPMGPFRFH
jgi:hypothetical protein